MARKMKKYSPTDALNAAVATNVCINDKLPSEFNGKREFTAHCNDCQENKLTTIRQLSVGGFPCNCPTKNLWAAVDLRESIPDVIANAIDAVGQLTSKTQLKAHTRGACKVLEERGVLKQVADSSGNLRIINYTRKKGLSDSDLKNEFICHKKLVDVPKATLNEYKMRTKDKSISNLKGWLEIDGNKLPLNFFEKQNSLPASTTARNICDKFREKIRSGDIRSIKEFEMEPMFGQHVYKTRFKTKLGFKIVDILKRWLQLYYPQNASTTVVRKRGSSLDALVCNIKDEARRLRLGHDRTVGSISDLWEVSGGGIAARLSKVVKQIEKSEGWFESYLFRCKVAKLSGLTLTLSRYPKSSISIQELVKYCNHFNIQAYKTFTQEHNGVYKVARKNGLLNELRLKMEWSGFYFDYKGACVYRSSFEAIVANILLLSNCKHEYEPFEREGCRPDFIVGSYILEVCAYKEESDRKNSGNGIDRKKYVKQLIKKTKRYNSWISTGEYDCLIKIYVEDFYFDNKLTELDFAKHSELILREVLQFAPLTEKELKKASIVIQTEPKKKERGAKVKEKLRDLGVDSNMTANALLLGIESNWTATDFKSYGEFRNSAPEVKQALSNITHQGRVFYYKKMQGYILRTDPFPYKKYGGPFAAFSAVLDYKIVSLRIK